MSQINEDINYPEMDYFMNESLSDVMFVIDGQPIPANKHMLSYKSRAFRAMFSGNFRESEDKVIAIEDTTFDAFKTMIYFMYTEKLVFNDDNDLQHICDVYQLSDRYEVLRIRQKVSDHFQTLINVKDLLSIARVVSVLNSEELMAKVMSFMTKNIKNLVKRDVLELQELNVLTNNKLLDLLTEESFIDNQKNVPTYVWLYAIKRDLKSVRSETTNFEVFKTLIAYLYLDKLVLKDDNDFKLIREVCSLSKRLNLLTFLNHFIRKHLEERISIENLLSISEIAFYYDIKELTKQILTFIDSNINHLFKRDAIKLRELDVLTYYGLLDVLTDEKFTSGQITVYTKDKSFTINRELLIEDCFVTNEGQSPVHELRDEDISFKAFKTFLGYLYFGYLIRSEDFQLIRELCELSKRYKQMKLLNEIIAERLEKRISVENLESISRIAFDYKIDGLMESVMDFTKQNISKIIDKSDDILIKINDSTDNTLFKMFANFTRINKKLL